MLAPIPEEDVGRNTVYDPAHGHVFSEAGSQVWRVLFLDEGGQVWPALDATVPPPVLTVPSTILAMATTIFATSVTRRSRDRGHCWHRGDSRVALAHRAVPLPSSRLDRATQERPSARAI